MYYNKNFNQNEFLDDELDRKYNYGLLSKNTHSTSIVESVSGNESRMKNWYTSKKEYSLEYSVKTLEEVKSLRDFFDFCSGSFRAFRFFDYSDCISYKEETKTKNLGRNYVRLEREIQKNNQFFNKTIPSFENIDFLEETQVIDFIDKISGKIYLHRESFTERNNLIDKEDATLSLANLTESDKEKLLKNLHFGYVYVIDDKNNEIELEVTYFNKQENKIYFIENEKIEKNQEVIINFYPTKVNLNIIKDVNFLYIVRFAEDEFEVKFDDFNILSTKCDLIEVLTED